VLPLEGHATVDAIIPVGDTRPIGQQIVANHLQVSAGYFHVLGFPLVRGRLLTPDDHARKVAIISQRTADTIWPGQDAIGRSFMRGNRDNSWEVVGIVANARISGLEEEATLVAYVPYGLGTGNRLSLVVRGQGDTRGAVTEARRVLKELDPQLPLQRVRTLESVVDDAVAMRRFQMWLMVGFCAAGLLLACLGIYGVLSEVVEGRRAELAIRLVLGASPGTIRGLVIRQGLIPIATGIVVGLVGGVLAARVVVALLFGVTPTQPVVIAAVIAIVLLVGLASAIEPAIRAARTPLGLTLRRS
jgi:putative ABC transport system permease protein